MEGFANPCHSIWLVYCIAMLWINGQSVFGRSGTLSDWNCVTDGLLKEVEELMKDERCNGRYQSPINFQLSATRHNPRLDINFHNESTTTTTRTTMHRLFNTGHTVELEVRGPRMEISGEGFANRYKLEQLHFHWGSEDDIGSEHQVDGRSYPMELHLVHWNHIKYRTFAEAAVNSSGLAVVGVFFQIVEDEGVIGDTFLKFARNLENIVNSTEEVMFDVDQFTLSDLLPRTVDILRYSGSLTTPPCTENVMWTVVMQPLPITRPLLDKFRQIPRSEDGDVIHANYRPAQPVNGREVQRSFAELRSGAAGNTQQGQVGLLAPAVSTCMLIALAALLH